MISLADLQGHWRRNWLRAPGTEDLTTRVHWLQAGQWCADIRVPLSRPGLEAGGSLSDMAPSDLAILLSAEGFAGRVTLDGDLCTWHREWNWRGFPTPVDAGILRFDSFGRLVEDGAHSDYREEWQCVLTGPWIAEAVEADGADGLLLSHDAGFVLALGQRGAPSWPGLPEALRDGSASAEEVSDAFASVYVLGHWSGEEGIADLSTQPFCEGHAVLSRRGDSAQLVLPDFHGRMVEQTLRLSEIPVNP